jgi:hypothetical protein
LYIFGTFSLLSPGGVEDQYGFAYLPDQSKTYYETTHIHGKWYIFSGRNWIGSIAVPSRMKYILVAQTVSAKNSCLLHSIRIRYKTDFIRGVGVSSFISNQVFVLDISAPNKYKKLIPADSNQKP